MSGPKHLWSGDWQRESDAASDELAGRRPQPAEPEPAVPAPDPARPRPRDPVIPKRLRSPRALGITLVAVLFLAAAAFGLTALLGSSGSPASTSAAAPPFQPAPAPAATTATTPPTPAIAPSSYVSWLGMQIETLPPGAAVIETVRLGSPGDAAGLEPGDVILAVNHRSINGASDIAAAIHGLHAGHRVELQISQGSALTEIEVTLAAPPFVHP